MGAKTQSPDSPGAEETAGSFRAQTQPWQILLPPVELMEATGSLILPDTRALAVVALQWDGSREDGNPAQVVLSCQQSPLVNRFDTSLMSLLGGEGISS